MKDGATFVIYLTGKPGVGKYTISKELARKYDFIICDNHLINNPIFTLLKYDGYKPVSEFAWDKIADIRAAVFEFLAKYKENNYILTNNLYADEGDKNLYEQVEQMAKERGSFFVPVRISVSQDEHLRRIIEPERRERLKSIDVQYVYDNTPLLPIMHPNFLALEVTDLKPGSAAEVIMTHINNLIALNR